MSALETDITDLLKPGVYLLRQGTRVVYIGRAKCLLLTLASHRGMWGKHVPAWFTIPNVHFDAISVIPCASDRAAAMIPALIALHDPIHNRPAPSHPLPAPEPSSPRIPNPFRRSPAPCPSK